MRRNPSLFASSHSFCSFLCPSKEEHICFPTEPPPIETNRQVQRYACLSYGTIREIFGISARISRVNEVSYIYIYYAKLDIGCFSTKIIVTFDYFGNSREDRT